LGAEEENRLRTLVQQSERAYAAGDAQRGIQLLFEAQKLAPEHPAVLNAAGVRALDAGHGAQAVDLLRRAIARDENNATLWVNLAAALRQQQKPDEEAAALERALALEPRHLVALLAKAALIRRRSGPRAAAAAYGNALKSIAPGASVPEALQPALREAMLAVRANSDELERHIGERLAHSAPGVAPSARFEHAIGAFVGKRRIYQPDPTQLHVPMLPALEFHAREDYPWLERLEAATSAVRSEFERVFAEDQGSLVPYIAYPDSVPLDQWRELNRSRRWSAYFLWRDGKPVEQNLARCPQTAELLRSLPQHTVPGHAPAAFFSILDAGAHIPPHTGVTNSRVIVHLPLVVPPGCRFRVGSTTREWHAGEAWVFDDTIEHEAWNTSDAPRAILIFDIWNPFLTAAERELVREAVVAIADYYGGEGQASPFLGSGP
jgi:aspartate beta-hydroxylase